MQVAVIGDLMLDKYLYGKVERISPEAPVPVLQLSRAERLIGGAGNVALNLAGLGSKVHLFAAIGDDNEGRLLRDLLKKQGIEETGILPLHDYKTTVKTRLIGGTQQLMRVDEEQYRELSEAERTHFLDSIASLLKTQSIDGIVLQDYNKGLLSKAVIEGILAMASKHDVPVAVDPKFANFKTFTPVSIFKPNLRELEAALGYPVNHDRQILEQAVRDLRRFIKADVYAVTLSEHGILLSSKGDENGIHLIPTRKRNVVDVCGAGDAVISALLLGYLAGCDLEMLGRLANAAGGYVCEKVGVVPVRSEEILPELEINK